MADFRKWLYAFAVVALLAGFTVPASAQNPLMTCTGSANNPLIRAEEYTAQAGDVFITCTGGTPTVSGNLIPKVNITVFVTNTTITSKITDTGDRPNFNEALLVVDEAGSVNSPNGLLNCGEPTYAPYSVSPNDLTCNIVAANSGGTGDYDGTQGRPNVFQGRQYDGSFGQAIQFLGVPVNAPGPGNGTQIPVRTLRITNLRVNAVALNVTTGTSFSLVTINTTISFNGTNFGGNQIVNVQNGTVRVGLLVDGVDINSELLANDEDYSEVRAATFLQCNARSGITTSGILLTEGFPTAFKVRNWSQIEHNGNAPATLLDNWSWDEPDASITDADYNQNVPNALYNTESGLMYPGASCTGLSNPPSGNPPPSTGAAGTAPTGRPFSNGQGICQAGIVSQGTRFAIRFSGIPAGSNPSVDHIVELHTGNIGDNLDTGALILVCGTDSHGQGGSPTSCTNGGIAGYEGAATQVLSVDSSGNAFAVYEVAFSNPVALEFAHVPVYVNPAIDLNANPPVGGTPEVGVTGTAVASFAPFYAATTAGVGSAQQLTSSFPIPRFRDDPQPTPPISLYTYSKCACDLLFPWVVGDSTVTTSIVVANTSLDPCAGTACGAGFTAQPQTGKVTFWFFGTSDISFNPSNFGSATGSSTITPKQTTSVIVPAGSYAAFIVSPLAAYAGGQTASNGLGPIAGNFAGYVIAQSEFQYCHGVASLSGNPGTNLQPQTYLGLVLDKARSSRGGGYYGGYGNNSSYSYGSSSATQLQRTNQAFADELEN